MFFENSKIIRKISDNNSDKRDLSNDYVGREADIAKYAKGYQGIMPVGAVAQIRYSPQREQQQRKQGKKEHPFEVLLQIQLREAPMEEDQRFQVYC